MTARARTCALVFVALVACALACDDEPEGPAERAAEIAQEIQASPDDAEEILEDHEMSIDDFEALMYEIAADPELSERYQALLENEE